MPKNNEQQPDNNEPENSRTKNASYDVRMKRLIRICFKDLITSFFPKIAAEIDFTDFGEENFLAEELFPEFKFPGLMRSDTVVKVKLKGSATPSIFILVEAQRTKDIEFVRRMFKYFALLYIRFNAPVIPIAIYVDDDKWEITEKWNSLKIELAGYTFLDFRFLTLKPKNLSLKDYLRNPNPAVTALATQMDLGDLDIREAQMQILNNVFMNKEKKVIMELLDHNEAFFIGGKDLFFECLTEIFKKDIKKEISMWREMLLGDAKDEILKQGWAGGARQTHFRDAESFSNLGVSWDTIEKATGITEQQLLEWIKGGRE